MKISVRVTTNSKKARVFKEDNNSLKVWVDARPLEGRANKRLVEILSTYYNMPKSSFEIVSGLKGKNKIVEIYDK